MLEALLYTHRRRYYQDIVYIQVSAMSSPPVSSGCKGCHRQDRKEDPNGSNASFINVCHDKKCGVKTSIEN